jgi:hypothetical protein
MMMTFERLRFFHADAIIICGFMVYLWFGFLRSCRAS